MSEIIKAIEADYPTVKRWLLLGSSSYPIYQGQGDSFLYTVMRFSIPREPISYDGTAAGKVEGLSWVVRLSVNDLAKRIFQQAEKEANQQKI